MPDVSMPCHERSALAREGFMHAMLHPELGGEELLGWPADKWGGAMAWMLAPREGRDPSKGILAKVADLTLQAKDRHGDARFAQGSEWVLGALRMAGDPKHALGSFAEAVESSDAPMRDMLWGMAGVVEHLRSGGAALAVDDERIAWSWKPKEMHRREWVGALCGAYFTSASPRIQEVQSIIESFLIDAATLRSGDAARPARFKL